METQREREIDHGHCGGKVATVVEKGKRRTSTQGSTGGKTSLQLQFVWKVRGATSRA